MGTIWHIDNQLGSNGNDGLTESTPKLTIPTGADGDVYKLKRGGRYDATGQIGFGTRQGIIVTSYGNPAAPKPIISAVHDASSSSINCQGDAIFHDVVFDYIQRTGTQTTDSNVGQNAILFGVRGGASAGTAEGVSGVIIGCDFSRIGNNAISYNGCSSDSHTAYAAPVGIILGCTFDDLGGDCMFGAVRDYLEIGYNKMVNMGSRIDTSQTVPPGSRQSAADGINMIYGTCRYAWLHDNWIDHSAWDCKHSIMVDAPEGVAPKAGYVVIERNVIIGYGVGLGQLFAQSINNVGINCELPGIIRHNYIRAGRIGLYVHSNAEGIEVYGNVFDIVSVDPNSVAAISIAAAKSKFYNNTVWGRTYLPGSKGVNQVSTATQSQFYRNAIGNFEEGLSLVNPTQAVHFENGYYNCTRNVSYNSAPYTQGLNDRDIDPSWFADAERADFRPTDLRLMFKRVDKKQRDFWGRFSWAGIAHIGACAGVVW